MDLIEFWGSFEAKSSPYYHPLDKDIILRNYKNHFKESSQEFNEYLLSDAFGSFGDNRMELSLLPVPFAGDLNNAKIIILLLNPGLNYGDYHSESNFPNYKKRVLKNLKQDFSDTDFPFLWLDPNYAWHCGFRWWEEKLRKVIKIIAEKRFKNSYYNSLKYVSQNIANIELIPYHSVNFKSSSLINKLPSAIAAKAYVKNYIQNEARLGNKTVIITRKSKDWDISNKTPNVEIYKGGQTRGASLGPDTPGGIAILKALL